MVERFFRLSSENRLSRGVLASVPDLAAAIDESIVHRNTPPNSVHLEQACRDILQKSSVPTALKF
jgi:hypothetical protein